MINQLIHNLLVLLIIILCLELLFLISILPKVLDILMLYYINRLLVWGEHLIGRGYLLNPVLKSIGAQNLISWLLLISLGVLDRYVHRLVNNLKYLVRYHLN